MAINVTLGLIKHPSERQARAVCGRSHLLRQEGQGGRGGRKQAGLPSLSTPTPNGRGTGPVKSKSRS